MTKWILTPMLGGMLLSGTWAANCATAQQADPPAPPAPQAGVIVVDGVPLTLIRTGTGTQVVPAGAPAVSSDDGASATFSGVIGDGSTPPPFPGLPEGGAGEGRMLMTGPGVPPGGRPETITIRRGQGVMPGPNGPGPMAMPAYAPGGGAHWIARATFPGKAVKAAFLGVITMPASATLRSQLKLKAGLVVDMVEPNSSAAAGLEVHDIIEKCDDQWLINPAQFVGLIRMYKPGDTVTLTVLREGARKKIAAKLEERQIYEVADDDRNVFYARQGMVDGNRPEGNFSLFTSPVAAYGPVQQITARAMGAAPLAPGFVATFGDDKQQLLITVRDGHMFLTAKDPNGKQIFEGPIDTPEQRKLVPEDVRKKLEEMEKIKVRIRTPDFAEPAAGPETAAGK